MRHGTFLWFILPSLAAMLLFIALPLGSVMLQSLHVEHAQVLRVVETCGPFGCTQDTVVDRAATERLRSEHPLGRFVGLQNFLDRNHLATDELAAAWAQSADWPDFVRRVMVLPFWRAMAFTLSFTAVVTPFVLVLGLMVALAVNAIPRALRGPTIFVSLLPMIVTPLVGSLILFWMVDARGILGYGLRWLSGDPELSVKASPALTWAMLMVYGIWSSAPFAFIVFYAGLQTVPQETLEAAMVDGASRWQRLRYVVIPHLAPLAVFVTLIQLMDNFRVLEPIVGFQAQANATSLSYNIYNYLRGDAPQFNAAATTSMLTVAGVMILLSPVVIRTWRDFSRKRT
jgi:ABC-type sugar transport system permease subunit